MTLIPPSLIKPALENTARIVNWGIKKSLAPAPDLPPVKLDVAIELQLADSSEDFVVLEHVQYEEIRAFLADPAVVSLLRLRFLRRLAPADAAAYLDEVASFATFQQLVFTWCADRGQAWRDLADHIWVEIERGHDALLKRVDQSKALSEAASDLLLNRFLFGFIGAPEAPEYVRLINELAHNSDLQRQVNDFLQECEIRARNGIHDEFLVLGLEHDRAKFEDLYVDRDLLDAVTGEAVSASQQLDIREACPRVVVIGDPGVGKSTLTTWAKWKTISESTHGHSPVIVTLVSRYDLADASSTILSAIKHHFQTDFLTDPNEKLLAYLFSIGWITLVVDGIDEILDVTQRRKVVDQLNAMAEKYPATAIICTIRRVGFEIARFRSPTFRVLRRVRLFWGDAV